MVKEIWKLFMMLFGKSPDSIQQLEMMSMKHFPARGYKYMMWCGRIIYREENRLRILGEMGSDRHLISMNHETIHLMQAKEKGSWWRFYWCYLWEWLKGNPFCHPAKSAYYTSKYECEAYANEEDFNYVTHYDAKNIRKYDIPDAKRKYKELGCSRKWKEYIRTL